MPVTPAEIRSFFEAKARRRAEANHALWSKAKVDADAIIAHIANNHHPTRIWQWGSVVHPDKFTDVSDIDIALEGVTDPAEFFAILGEAESMTPFSVDIVQLECIMPEFAEIIRQKGKIVYEC
jgi:predicted nucleotidyltransferase